RSTILSSTHPPTTEIYTLSLHDALPILNVVTISAANDTNPANNTATDTDTLTPQVDAGVTKTDGVLTAVPGTSTTYTIVVTNTGDRKSTRLNSSHDQISYAVFCLKKKKI